MFLYQSIYILQNNRKVQERLLWESKLILLISAVICKQRKLHENKVTQHFWNQKRYEVR